ncbi:MAG: hypothetical protein WC093_07885, partial [Methanoculleus sp.]
MTMRYCAVLILILGLVAVAAGAGDPAPVLPHVFYGGVTIAGSPAPVGTEITARIGGIECGSIQIVDAGQYGSHDESLGNRLVVAATADQAREAIAFFVNGVAAQETANFTSGAVTALDLSAAAGESTPTPTSTPGNGGGGDGGPSTGGPSSKDPVSEITYDPDAPLIPEVFTGNAPLTTSAAGVVLEPVTVTTEDKAGA